MMDLLYAASRYTYKTRYNASGGMVATFVGNREVGPCNEKGIPIGFYTNDASAGDNCMVLVGQGEFRTDLYEKDTIYKVGDLLYCSSEGKITNEQKYRGNIIIGIVNQVFDVYVGLVICFARHIEEPILI